MLAAQIQTPLLQFDRFLHQQEFAQPQFAV